MKVKHILLIYIFTIAIQAVMSWINWHNTGDVGNTLTYGTQILLAYIGYGIIDAIDNKKL